MDVIDDLTSDCFQALRQFQEHGGSITTPQAVHERFDYLLHRFKERSAGIGLPAADADLILYAIVALADEIALKKPEPLRGFWVERQLAIRHCNDSMAGNGFFHRLETLRREGRADLLRVYYLCLLFGFQGRYSGTGEDLTLLRLEEAARADVLRSTPRPRSLGHTALSDGRRARRRLWYLASALAMLIVTGSMFVTLRVLLDRQVSQLADYVDEINR